uniref:Uncharacterized protein n=1 Tax=Arundo donax TaxID=35708 RepID=A0A0A8YIY9_ARUDO
MAENRGDLGCGCLHRQRGGLPILALRLHCCDQAAQIGQVRESED